METFDAMMSRRSVRAYQAEPLPVGAIEKILQAAAAAPSGGNRQPWAFIAVCDRRRLQGVLSLAPGMPGMPAAVVAICLDEHRCGPSVDGDFARMVWMDLGAAMQNILLAAHDQQLGACPIGSFHADALAALFKLPPHVKIALLVAIGVPARVPSAPPKRPLEEVVSFETYGGPHASRA